MVVEFATKVKGCIGRRLCHRSGGVKSKEVCHKRELHGWIDEVDGLVGWVDG